MQKLPTKPESGVDATNKTPSLAGPAVVKNVGPQMAEFKGTPAMEDTASMSSPIKKKS
jgi:hypothetical protein